MSRNRVQTHQRSGVQTSVRQRRSHQWINIIPALVLALGLGGCALNSAGLPSGLPVPPGGGTLSISRTTLVNGIQGRTYTIWIPTSGGTGTLAAGGCTIIAGGLPAGLSIATSDDNVATSTPATTAVRFCKITGTITTVGPATVNFTVSAADTATPANTASQAFSIFVRPEFAVTTVTAFKDAVSLEHYGDAAQTCPGAIPCAPQPVVTNVTATQGNAPLTVCSFAISGSSGFILTPAAVPAGATANTCNLSSLTNAVGAAGSFTVTLTATDTDITDNFPGQLAKVVVPKKAIVGTALALKVNPALVASFNQSGNTNPISTLLDGVNVRSYGVITAGAGAPTWSVTGGLGAGAAGVANYGWCVSAGGASVTAVGLAGISTNCAAPTAGVASVKLTSASAATGVASFSVAVTDTGNAAVISRTATQGTSVINALATLTASFVQGVVSLNTNPNSTLLNGVNLQSYGVITTNAGAPKYTAAGGLGAGTVGVAAYRWCVNVGGATVTAIGLSGISTNCGAPTTGSPLRLTSAAAVTGAAAFSVQLIDDTGNAATPTGGPITFGTSTITVFAAFAATFNQAGNTIAASTLLPGVDARSYGVITAGAGAPTWLGAGGLGAGTAGATNYKWCVSSGGVGVTAIGLSGISTICAAPTTSGTGSVKLTSAAAVAGGPIPFSVAGTDAGNEATPSVTITQGPSSITINAILSVALAGGSPNPTTSAGQAVLGRTYGAPAKTNVVYQVSGGLPVYVITPSGTLTTATNILCVSGATTSTCNSASANVTNTGGVNPSLTISATDTANAATPAGAAALGPQIWTVNVVITFSLLPGPTGVAPNGVIPDGVVLRQYGKPLGANDLVFTASGGLGNAAGFGLTGTATGTFVTNSGLVCVPTTTQVGASVTVTCNSGGGASTLGGTATAKTLVVTFSDAGNSTTPSGATNTDSGGFTNYANNVNAGLLVALQGGSPNPTTAAGQAVVGRTYGAPAKTNVVYLVSGGLPAYVITPSGTLTTATNIACVSGATTSTCNSANANATNSGGVNPSLTVSATDTANSTTPFGAASKTDIWTVNVVITFSLLPGPTGVAPNGVIPDGVVLRQYGKPLGANDLVFTASGGLGNAAGFGLTGTATGTFVTNSGLVCVPTTTQVGASVTVTCNSGGGVSTLGGTATAKTLVMTFSDAGNSTTPAGATNTDSGGFTNYANNVNAALALALQALSPDPANVNAQAVVGQTYGAVPQAPVVYVATNGLPAYTFVRSGTLLVNSNICAVQNTTATTLTCNSNSLAVTGTTGVLTVTVNDTGNATTPSGSAALPKTYTVNAALSMLVAPNPASPTATAVIGRAYGIPAGLLSPTYTASGGLSIYTYALSNPPGAGITCTSGAIPASVCSSAAVTAVAPVSFVVTVTDGGNLTTPANAVGVTITRTFTVNAALAITTTSLKNGLKDFTYAPTGAGAPGEILTSTGGIGARTWVPGGTTNGPCSPTAAQVPALPPGLTLGAASGLLSGIPTAASVFVLPIDPTEDFTFGVCVFDTANATTPRGIPAPLPTYTVNIMDTIAATAGFGADTVEAWDTGTNSSIGFVALALGDFPFGVAVTPNGRKLYVTANGNDVVQVIDTITGLVTATISLAPCSGPQGIAMALPGGGPTAFAFVGCSNRRIAVINASTDTFVSAANYGTALADFYGVAVTPNDTRVYVTDAANNEFVVLDATATCSPSCTAVGTFSAGVTAPHGVVISAAGNRAYLAGSGSGNVIVLSTANNTTVVAGPISTGSGSAPESLARTPDALGAHVYVTLTGADAFAVFDDTLGTPALTPTRNIDPAAGVGAVRAANVVTITTTAAHGFAVGQRVIITGVTNASFAGIFTIGSTTATTFTYPQVAADATSEGGTASFAGALASSPFGITIPPIDALLLTSTGLRVYIGESTDSVFIRDDETVTPFGPHLLPSFIPLPLGTAPRGVTHIPVPR